MEIDIKKAAKMIGTSEATLRRWARQGKIPARERSGAYVFDRGELAKWARRRNLTVMDSPFSADTVPAIREVGLYESMKRGGVFLSVPGSDVEEVLEAASKLTPLPNTVDWETLLDQLLEREQLSSTGLGHGVAIPHPRYPMEDIPAGGMITTCFLQQEVDFSAVDGKPVFILFLMLSNDTKTHLKLLSHLSFCLRDRAFIDFLRECRTTEMFLPKVKEMQDRIKPDGERGGS